VNPKCQTKNAEVLLSQRLREIFPSEALSKFHSGFGFKIVHQAAMEGRAFSITRTRDGRFCVEQDLK
jgi:hypothetical protein